MEYQPLKFSNGEIVMIRRAGLFIGTKLQRQYPDPKPPMQRVNFGTDADPDWREEANPADPEYEQALQKHRVEAEERLFRTYVRLGCKIEWTTEKRELLAEYRAVMQEEGVELEQDDNLAYIRNIACGDPEDYQTLLSSLMGVNQPTEEAVKEYQEAF